jgi:hypothetical protein
MSEIFPRGWTDANGERFKIAELKDHFEDNDNISGNHTIEIAPSATEGPELLFGCNKYATKHGLLSSIPTRAVVDRLISIYFHAMDMAPGKSLCLLGH